MLANCTRTMFFIALTTFALQAADQFSWQQPHAEIVKTGDLKWKPAPFKFVAGATVKYIDYENGSDSNAGTKASPWKHHPWDNRAGGKAKAFSGVATYVFKRGVTYRLESAVLTADDSGKAGDPIRLTSDPNWGKGEAVIAGSAPIKGTWKKAGAGDGPKGMDTSKQTVWFIDVQLPKKPGGRGTMNEAIVYEVQKNGEITDLHVASDVGWEYKNPHFPLDHWNTWDQVVRMGQRARGGYKDNELKGKYDANALEGGTVWSQYAWVIANPTPDPIKRGDYNPQRGTLDFKKGSEPINPGTRYLIEDVPMFLDTPREYYYSKKQGRLFVRLPEDRNPNNVRIEMSTAFESLILENRHHIDVSGLSFRFNGRKEKRFWETCNAISITGSCSNITIRNCRFSHMATDAIRADVANDQTMDHINVMDCDFNWINGGSAIYISGSGGLKKPGPKLGRLYHSKVLRNRVRNIGLYRHDDHKWSNVAALTCSFPMLGEIAGNIIYNTWGSGIVSQGGVGGKSSIGFDLPLSRILVHHNKSEYNALCVNDYGGLSLWQHGSIYAYNNILGNSVGFWPGGFGNSGDRCLSYPIYLDGGFKIFCFNNIVWGLPYDESKPWTRGSSSFFNVFGYMNPFINNTIYAYNSGFGGTSGNRNDYLGNVFADIHHSFINVNHGGNPSLIGGDDNAESGIDGASTLAYGYNVFHGPAKAGVVTSTKRGAKKDVEADDLETLKKQMQDYPLRFAHVGTEASKMPIARPIPGNTEAPLTGDADFRPSSSSPGVNNGVRYFVPWSLYATVGEWNFNANRANPAMVLDYHYYPTEAYFNRSMYYRVPTHELRVNNATLKDYTKSAAEDWVDGALVFDGSRLARAAHKEMARDIALSTSLFQKKQKKVISKLTKPWKTAAGKIIYPAAERKTLDIKDSNLLVETILKTSPRHTGGVILGKFDGKTGYRLVVNGSGQAEFQLAAGDAKASVATGQPINDGKWHHVLAEIDRETGQLTIYLDGKKSNESTASVKGSLSNGSDFIVGADHNEKNFLQGAIDFMRVAQGTLKDAETSIEELFAWQFHGPHYRDFSGNEPKGKRDAGALERN